MKMLAKKLLNRVGYDIMRIRETSSSTNIFHVAFTSLMSTKQQLSVVQVGANDGMINDPLFPMMKRFADRTKIILIEPQPALIPYLTENYQFHPSAVKYNGAIGDIGTLDLYAIKKEAWVSLDVHYAKNWPPYRAPTGLTSGSRDHVKAWLTKHYRGQKPADEMIERLSVPCGPLAPLLELHGWEKTIDVLQVDAEGYDDQVIYACEISKSKPFLINFEWHGMRPTSQVRLRVYLERLEYTLFRHDGDMLAIAV